MMADSGDLDGRTPFEFSRKVFRSHATGIGDGS
jgi:hypothetical protein